jgi:hypothetical protein
MTLPAATEPSLQERYAPAGRCFGCGPANPIGLRVGSRPDPADDSVLIADWMPLLDCHANWTAAWHLMRARGADRPPTTVTLEYAIRMRRPTPSGAPIHLRARVVESSEDRATIEAEISSHGTVTATGRGTFVAVKPDHPAFDRW